jgi:hypothetical protein
MQLQALYSDVRDWEELVDLIEQNCSPKEPFSLTAIYKCNLTQDEVDQEYMGSYTPGQTMNYRLSGQISYNSSHLNTCKLKLGHNVKLFLVEIKTATWIDIEEHVMRLGKIMPTSLVPVSYTPLLIRILRLRREPMKINELWMRTQME